MKLPNMDTRSIRRLEDVEPGDHFTIDPASSIQTPGRSICNHCGRQKCKLRAYLSRVPVEMAVARVQSCAWFIPVLGFSVLDGLDLVEWNTVRIGAAWSNRLQVGKRVYIANTVAKKIVGSAVVTYSDTARLDQILAMHAVQNHAIQAEIATGKTRPEDAATRLLRILKNAYGTSIAAESRPASVIYLRRDDDGA
ncbi:MAG: hypothetical protein LPK02_07395 [Rhodobacterales bacterium]|nr:hypothetical protein [Rhodobacterales bacterium]